MRHTTTLLPPRSPSQKPSPRTSRTTPPVTADPWHDWQPQWHDSKKASTPHSVQEKHSPTVPVTLRVSASRDDYTCQRRLLDARLWDSLPREAQDAAADIAFAYEALTKGMGAATSNWARVPGARNPAAVANAHGRLSGSYMDWAASCTREGISHSMIIDVICMGISCSALDRDRRVRKGTSRQNLHDGLMLYARQQGWVRGAR